MKQKPVKFVTCHKCGCWHFIGNKYAIYCGKCLTRVIASAYQIFVYKENK